MDDMGTKKSPTRRHAVRLPDDLDAAVIAEAKLRHGGDFTAAVIWLLSKALEAKAKEERWIREGAAREAESGGAPVETTPAKTRAAG